MTKFATLAAGLILFTTGCGDKAATNPDTDHSVSGSDVTVDGLPPATADVHAHPSEGPHHGSLVELGNEEYHAEVVHDEKSVTVYILDSAAKKAVPIDASEVTINLMHDGTPEQFKLAASPDSGDADGKSSRFTLPDAALVGHIDDEASAPKLSVTIEGTAYRGEIKHDHDHEGHDHAGHDH
ncbi:putative secreted protein [Rhodopirellula maiorica SM1]|uniref:Putative secreted protein n=2 Tax=Novipirellula TaxID=2795426 RepID=M5R7E1_9BACT|nr:putative secreted protein [Rhodopirellula maiorica SM1]